MEKYCVKLRRPFDALKVKTFDSPEERSTWLRENGYYESQGVYRHINGSVAGIYTQNLFQLIKIARTCDNPVKVNNAWTKMWTR